MHNLRRVYLVIKRETSILSCSIIYIYSDIIYIYQSKICSFRTNLKYYSEDKVMNFFLDEYLDYLQDSSATKVFIGIGLIYSAFKNWKQRHEIENGECKKYKEDSHRLDVCVAEVQIKKSKTIISQLKAARHTCADTGSPSRCQEKVRYFIDKYEEKIYDLSKLVYKTKLKISKKEYKEKLKKIKQSNK